MACLVGIFERVTTPVTASLYAVREGLRLGCISQVFQLRSLGELWERN